MLAANDSALIWASQCAKNGKEEDAACVALARRLKIGRRKIVQMQGDCHLVTVAWHFAVLQEWPGFMGKSSAAVGAPRKESSAGWATAATCADAESDDCTGARMTAKRST
jgi:hypothetical protein